MKRLFLIINEDRFFLSHRQPIAQIAKENGWEVAIVTKNTGRQTEIEKEGYRYIELPVNPLGKNIIEEKKQYSFLRNLAKENPDALFHFVGLKNMLWGGLAVRDLKTRGNIFAISGLGTMFGEGSSKILSAIIRRLLKIGMNGPNNAVIFQNHDDESLFRNTGITQKCTPFFIKGSGVDLQKFHPDDKMKGEKLQIVFTGRLIREKGVEDLLDAAEILKKEYKDKIRFILCGGLSAHPKALKKETVKRLNQDDYVVWQGHCNNIPQILSQSDIMCFPSYYREGVPKSLIEGCAAGLPIVTYNSIGCRDTVDNGVNGFIVPIHSPQKISEALDILINNKELREKMGKESRKKAEREFNVIDVARMHLEIYEYLWRKSEG